MPNRGLLRNTAGHGRLLLGRPVDLRRRPTLLDRPRLLQPLLRRHVLRQTLHKALPQLHQHPQTSDSCRQVGVVLLRRHGEGVRLPVRQTEHGAALLRSGVAGQRGERDRYGREQEVLRELGVLVEGKVPEVSTSSECPRHAGGGLCRRLRDGPLSNGRIE